METRTSKSKKLSVKRESLSKLTEKNLANVVGGTLRPPKNGVTILDGTAT